MSVVVDVIEPYGFRNSWRTGHTLITGMEVKQTSTCEDRTVSVWSYTHGLSLPAWTTGHVLTSMNVCECVCVCGCVCVGVCEVERGGVGRQDERQPCTVISEVLRLKMTSRQGGLQLCDAC